MCPRDAEKGQTVGICLIVSLYLTKGNKLNLLAESVNKTFSKGDWHYVNTGQICAK